MSAVIILKKLYVVANPGILGEKKERRGYVVLKLLCKFVARRGGGCRPLGPPMVCVMNNSITMLIRMM
jgi:hypothetical protein